MISRYKKDFGKRERINTSEQLIDRIQEKMTNSLPQKNTKGPIKIYNFDIMDIMNVPLNTRLALTFKNITSYYSFSKSNDHLVVGILSGNEKEENHLFYNTKNLKEKEKKKKKQHQTFQQKNNVLEKINN